MTRFFRGKPTRVSAEEVEALQRGEKYEPPPVEDETLPAAPEFICACHGKHFDSAASLAEHMDKQPKTKRKSTLRQGDARRGNLRGRR